MTPGRWQILLGLLSSFVAVALMNQAHLEWYWIVVLAVLVNLSTQLFVKQWFDAGKS